MDALLDIITTFRNALNARKEELAQQMSAVDQLLAAVNAAAAPPPQG